MDFSFSDKTEQLRGQLRNFVDDHIMGRIGQWSEEIHAGLPIGEPIWTH